MIQIVTKEWMEAARDQQQPRWFIFTNSYIDRTCKQVSTTNPKWHADLSAPDLSKYMIGMAPRTQWWLDNKVGEDGIFPLFHTT